MLLLKKTKIQILLNLIFRKRLTDLKKTQCVIVYIMKKLHFIFALAQNVVQCVKVKTILLLYLFHASDDILEKLDVIKGG